MDTGEVYSLLKYIHYFQNSHSLLEHLRNQWNSNPDPVIYSGLCIPQLVINALAVGIAAIRS
tara:strand:+ start:292 stop:477 length:186 start_codon:yes stop_codon:yes gene_type:complete